MINKNIGIVIIILLCISLLLNVIVLSKVNSMIGKKQDANSSLFDPDTTTAESTDDTTVDPTLVTDIYLGYEFSPKTGGWEGKVYHLQKADDKCVFIYTNPKLKTSEEQVQQCDYSQDVYNDFLDLICNQKLEKYQYETDSDGKIVYDNEPYNLALFYKGQLLFYKNPSNMDNIVSKFEKLFKTSDFEETIVTPTPKPIHAENEIFPNSDTKRLNNFDIADMNMTQLNEALNEIYARHGGNEGQNDSNTDKDYSERLNRIEKYNVEFLKNAIREFEEKAA